MSTFVKKWHLGWFLLTVVAGACTGPEPGPAPSLEEAETAHIQLDLKRTGRVLEAVLNDEASSAEDRAVALERLAVLDWRFYLDNDRARDRLQQADGLGLERVETSLARARLETAAGNYRDAQLASRQAIAMADTRTEVKEARIAFARATMREALSQLTGTAPARENASGDLDVSLLREASDMMGEILEAEPGLLAPSSLQLGLALTLEDGPRALTAWRLYYRVPPGEPVDGLFREAGATLERILPGWEDRPLSRSERGSLVLALADSRFFDFAELLALDHRVRAAEGIDGIPAIQDVLPYAVYVRKVTAASDEHYRRTALGSGSMGEYSEAFDRAARELWNTLHFPTDKPRYTRKDFDAEVDRRFGARIRLHRTSSYYNLWMGHRGVDEKRRIEQYGHQADIRFVQLDFMVSKSYQSWFWDGRQAHGGWADESTITQVRGPYADDGFEAWEKLNDPQVSEKFQEEIREKTAADEFVAAENPYAYLEGLHLRLESKTYSLLLDSLTARGLEGSDLQLAFIEELEGRVWESSIFAHEGRHLIDRRIGRGIAGWLRPNSEGEFRAKLSEIAFAPDPYIGLIGGIINRNTGDRTAHGQANERLMKGIVAWMAEHAEELPGLDSSRPLLPQLDLLKADQIRAIFRSMDPLAR